jgi:cell wall-associated NlpC family hydrolase
VRQSGSETKVFQVGKNLINLYAKPDTGSEIVTQVLLNAKLIAETESNGFLYVKGSDNYHGWADSRHLVDYRAVDGCAFATVSNLVADVFSRPDESSALSTKLVLSTLVELGEEAVTSGSLQQIKLPTAKGKSKHNSESGWMRKSDLKYSFAETLSNWNNSDFDTRRLTAEKFIGIPYLWGGCSPFGIDCSGLVQVCYLMEGLPLLRDADIQYDDKRFKKVDPGESLSKSHFQAGDLLVFGSNTAIIHIGIASDDGRFIHASGRTANFGTYYNSCSDSNWVDLYVGAVRLAENAELSIESA